MKLLSVLPIAVTVSGRYLLFKLRFFFILNPKRTLMKAVSAVKGESAFSSLCLALAGTLGIGNIVGVAVGISVGGAGSVFWLFVSSLFAMIIKFSEATLSADMGGGLGMIGVVEKSFVRSSRILPCIYAALVLLLAFVMGAALQSSSAVECARESNSISEFVYCSLFFVALLFVILGGISSIIKFTSYAIPISCVVYVFHEEYEPCEFVLEEAENSVCLDLALSV